MNTATEFRTIAQQYHETKRAEQAKALQTYVEEQILPVLRQRAENGHYNHTIENSGQFSRSDVLHKLQAMGFRAEFNTHLGIRVFW